MGGGGQGGCEWRSEAFVMSLMRRHTNGLYSYRRGMSEVQGMYYLCCENIVADHLTAELVHSCSELFCICKAGFLMMWLKMHHVQIRD